MENEQFETVAEGTVVDAVDPGKKLGLISLILSAVGLVLCAILSCACGLLGSIIPIGLCIAGIVLGVLAMNKSKAAGFKNTLALVGIIAGAAGIVVAIIGIILAAIIGGAAALM